MRHLLPKNPMAAAGFGVLVGASIAGCRMWKLYKNGAVTRKEAVAAVVRQGALFGGVTGLSVLAGGRGGGGAGLAAVSTLGLGGGGGAVPGVLAQALGVGGRGGSVGGGGPRAGQTRAADLANSIVDSVAKLLEPDASPESRDEDDGQTPGSNGTRRPASRATTSLDMDRRLPVRYSFSCGIQPNRLGTIIRGEA